MFRCCVTSSYDGSAVHFDLAKLKYSSRSREKNVYITSLHFTFEGHGNITGDSDNCTSVRPRDTQHAQEKKC